jgi:imidazolonepropionase-like amidohydrolase
MLVPMLQQAGVTILAGTDAGFLNSFNYPGAGLHDELALLVASGLTPAQALRASVVNGPSFLKAADGYGAVAAGKVADLLVLERNPLEDISATRTIRAVLVKGQPFDRAALDAMLGEVEARAAGRPPASR